MISGGAILTISAMLFGDASGISLIFLAGVAIVGAGIGLSPYALRKMEIGRIHEIFKRIVHRALQILPAYDTHGRTVTIRRRESHV